MPMKASSNPPQASDWDFTGLDAVVQPVLGVTDHSPEYQIAVAPDLPGMLSSSGQLIVNPADLATFAAYCANLVRYYNTGGFEWGGKHFQSASSHPITWWGIFNEYNINGLTPSDYVELYDTVVPAMLAVDPTLQFSALELSDSDYQEEDPRNNLPAFVAPAASGGVSAPVNVASTHFYSSCNQSDSDDQIFSTVPGFAQDVAYFYQELRSTRGSGGRSGLGDREQRECRLCRRQRQQYLQPGTEVRHRRARHQRLFRRLAALRVCRAGQGRQSRRCITGTTTPTRNMARWTSPAATGISATGWITGWGRCFRRRRPRTFFSSAPPRPRPSRFWPPGTATGQ